MHSHLAFATEQKVRVLIFSGTNNHNWEETTPQLERILKSDPNFQVAITNHPETTTAEQLAQCDVIVSNWNNVDKPDLTWPESVRQAFLEFVRNGGGHVTVHAGGSSFNDWQEYHQMAAYWGKETYHGPYHEFAVMPVDLKHPIIEGIDSFKISDELWNNTCFPPNRTTLVTAFSSKDKRGTGKDEPILTINRCGKGRCVNLMLGHDARAMKNQNFRKLLLQSVRWAAIDSVEHTGYGFKKTDHSIALTHTDRTVWQFNYGKDLTKPYFHPLALTDGTVLTWESPPDHPWHYGLWFSWKYINGINFWEEDSKTGKSQGTTDWNNVVIYTELDHSAHIKMELAYHKPEETTFLSEKRTLVISSPDESGTYSIDWISEFTACADKVELSRTPLPWEKDGKPWGGYAGLSFRVCKDVRDSEYIGTFGSETPCRKGRYRFKDIAVEFSGVINDNVFGVAVLDHPDNLNFPSPWYLDDGNPMVYFSPAVLCFDSYTLSKNEILTLKYRIIIHPGRWDASELTKKHKHFLGN